MSGSYIDPARPAGHQVVVVVLLQVWDNGTWKVIRKADGTAFTLKDPPPLYPRLHVVSDGRVFMSGTNAGTLLLKTSDPGASEDVAFRLNGLRDYCPSVIYDADKIVYIGGGNELNTHVPTDEVETIDLSASPRRWVRAHSMNFPRRQHNGTLLPDGTVLVTGGTRGGGGPNNGFNDLGPGAGVHFAEIWNPVANTWTRMSAELIDRCYHATAVLLPDATVLSAGGGEYRPDNVNDNDPIDSHRNAQVFSPPYLFLGGVRPEITSAPGSIFYGDSFEIGTPQSADIGRVSFIRLASVTHSFDQSQAMSFLHFVSAAGKLTVTAPASANVCPPGFYMLFVVNRAGVPSVASIIQIRAAVRPTALGVGRVAPAAAVPAQHYSDVYARESEIAQQAKGTALTIGITGTCPYGIGSCWGGAYETLKRLEDVDLVSPVPNTDDSTAEVFLKDKRLPPLDRWHEQFRKLANGTYEMRGVEVTLQGRVQVRDGVLSIAILDDEAIVRVEPLSAAEKIQWDHRMRRRIPPAKDEDSAYRRLQSALAGRSGAQTITITGPLIQTGAAYSLQVRHFSI
jgi:hypothetical protein